MRQGDEGDSFYVIRHGNVDVVVNRPGGSPIIVARLGPSEGFGEMALLTGQPRSASVIALSEVEVFRLSRVAFHELLAESVSLLVYFNRILAQRLNSLQERMAMGGR